MKWPDDSILRLEKIGYIEGDGRPNESSTEVDQVSAIDIASRMSGWPGKTALKRPVGRPTRRAPATLRRPNKHTLPSEKRSRHGVFVTVGCRPPCRQSRRRACGSREFLESGREIGAAEAGDLLTAYAFVF